MGNESDHVMPEEEKVEKIIKPVIEDPIPQATDDLSDASLNITELEAKQDEIAKVFGNMFKRSIDFPKND